MRKIEKLVNPVKTGEIDKFLSFPSQPSLARPIAGHLVAGRLVKV